MCKNCEKERIEKFLICNTCGKKFIEKKESKKTMSYIVEVSHKTYIPNCKCLEKIEVNIG